MPLNWGLSGIAWFSVVSAVVLYPVLEEYVFRGGLQPWLAQHLRQHAGPLSLANLLTSVVFCALHFLFHPPLWALGVFLPSLVFGYFYERHQRVLSPVLLHVAYNASYTLIIG